MMTGCDLSAITKPWEVQSKVGILEVDNTALLSVLLPIWCMMNNLLLFDAYLITCCFQKRASTFLSVCGQ